MSNNSESTEKNLEEILSHCDLYQVLEIDKNTTPREIKIAYYKKSKVCHPDKGGDPKEFYLINIAYKILSNKENREKYDSEFHLDKFEKIKEFGDDIQYKDLDISVDNKVMDKLKKDFNKTFEEMLEIEQSQFKEKPIKENLNEYHKSDNEIQAILKTQKKINPNFLNPIFEKINETQSKESKEIVPFNVTETGALIGYVGISNGEWDINTPGNYAESFNGINNDQVPDIQRELMKSNYVSKKQSRLSNTEMNSKIQELKSERNKVKVNKNTKVSFVDDVQMRYYL